MEQYIVSARKYRPSSFASVVGQEALTATLKNAVATDHLAHAYLFCGSRGVGKTSCARIFAKTINCTAITPDGEACNECDSCRAFNEGGSMNIIEFDAASNNGVDDIKKIIEQVHIPPTQGRYRVFIIDEVHMLSNQAFNAFLKTLEEPPHYVIFVLATTEKHKIIPTILSRCQIYDFSRITIGDMVSHLSRVAAAEGITAETPALSVIAHQADGAMRDALSIFDQVAASCRGNITYGRTIEALNVLDSSYYNRLLDCIVKQDIPGALLIFNEIRRKGFDGQFFVNGLGAYFRSLMLAGNERTMALLDEPDDVRASLQEAAGKVSADFIYRAMNLCNEADLNYRNSGNKQMLVELMLIKIAQLLNPSPADSGRGEGSLKPITVSEAAQATAAPTTAAATPAAPAASQQPRQAYSPSAAAQAAQAARRPTPAATAMRAGAGPRIAVGAISIKGSRPAAQAETMTQRAEAYSAADVDAAWDRFIADNAAEPTLVNIMHTCRPVSTPSGWFITVPNDIAASCVTDHMGRLMTAMRDSLRNDSFALGINVSNVDPGPAYWSEQRVLDHMLRNNEHFRELYAEFKLTKL